MSENTNEVQESVVSDSAPSEAPSSPSTTNESHEAKSAPTEKYVPYERFNEVIQQKNEHSKAVEEYKRQVSELQAKFKEFSTPKEAPKANPLIERLKGIDPEFGKWAEMQEKKATELEELRTWRAESERQRTTAEVANTVDKLHSEYKVPEASKEIYTDMLRAEATRIEATGRVLTPKDLPSLYKSVHDKLGGLSRATLASYTAAKKADATTPTQAKGAAPKVAPPKIQFSKNKEEARSQIVKSALEQYKAHKNSL